MKTASAKTRQALTLRLMVPRDLPHVLRIEQQSADRRWTVQDFLTVLQSGHTVGQVAEVGEEVVGFVIYTIPPLSPLKDDGRPTPAPGRPPEAMEIELLNLAVAPPCPRPTSPAASSPPPPTASTPPSPSRTCPPSSSSARPASSPPASCTSTSRPKTGT